MNDSAFQEPVLGKTSTVEFMTEKATKATRQLAKLPVPPAPPSTMPPAPALQSMQEARRQLGTISRGLLYRIIDSGELQTVRLRGRRMIVTQSLHAYVARLMQQESLE